MSILICQMENYHLKEVIDKAVQNQGFCWIAIADHDTLEAYTEELYQYASSKNIKIICAVEYQLRLRS